MISGPTDMEVGTSASFKAHLDDGSSRSEVTETAQWTTTNPAVLTMAGGRAESRGAGQATLHASLGSLRATLVVTVSSPEPGPTATLIVESPSVTVSAPSAAGYYEYLVRFKLRETGGQSAATVGDIVVFGPNGSDRTGPGCWGSQLTVPAGGVLDTFDTDAGLNWLLYCAPGSGGRTPNPSLRVLIYYVDERGRSRSVESTIQGAP
jgi:hypothetical protein